MELRELEYFLAVADELHFGRAAARLHISQPPLTVHIKRLESELGVTLFNRTSRRVSLTAEGEFFRERVRPILRDLHTAVSDVQEVKAGRRGRVDVGFVSSASYSLIPAAVREIRRTHPSIHMDLHPMATGEQLEALLNQTLDLGIMRDAPIQAGVHSETLYTEQLVAVLPETHPLSRQQEVTPGELAGLPLILFPTQSMPGYVNNIMRLFTNLPVNPQIAQRAVNQENVLGLVAAGVGASILPESFSALHMPGVVTRPISTRPETRLELVTSTQEELTTTAQQFIAALKNVAQHLESQRQAQTR